MTKQNFMKIKELTIFTSQIEKQFEFYSKILGFELIRQSDELLSFSCGQSVLNIKVDKDFKPNHFTFNIPNNQEHEALKWLKARVPVLNYEGNEIQDFDFWNAKAIYFYDADKNILEFIARKNLDNSSDQVFSIQSILEISEIGLPTEDIEQEHSIINRCIEVPVYDGNYERFCALGDEQGLFICVNKNVKDWFPTGDKAYSANFEMLFEEQKAKFKAIYRDEKLSVSSG